MTAACVIPGALVEKTEKEREAMKGDLNLLNEDKAQKVKVKVK